MNTIEDGGGFFGRTRQIQEVIAILSDPVTPDRCLVVEGAPALGKTYFLREIAREIAQRFAPGVDGASPPVRVCFYTSTDLPETLNPEETFAASEVAYQLIARLWACVRDLFGPESPGEPPPLTHESLQEQLHKIALKLKELHESGSTQLLVLVLDGLDEISVAMLTQFELEFAGRLFDHHTVRLLSARRVQSTAHRWRLPSIRGAMRIVPLDPFDAPDQQVDALLAPRERGYATLHDLLQHYQWTNAGVNYALAQAYLREDTITEVTISAALDLLLTAPLLGSAAPITRQRLGDIVHRLLLPRQRDMVPRYEIDQLFSSLMPYDRQTFLAELFQRGVAFPDGSRVKVHPEIIELCHELQDRNITYGYQR